MAFPDKHQLKFNSHMDAKTLMEGIEKSSESLDQIHDRLQKVVSQLEINGVSLSQEDVNLNPQLDNEDLKQIDVDDLKEMDLRWQMAMVLICLKWSVITAIRKNILQGSVGSYDWSFQAEEEPANYALMGFSSSRSSSDNESKDLTSGIRAIWRTLLKKTTFLHTRLTFSVSMDSISPQVISAAKLPILNPNEFDLWKMRIEQYFLMTDYSLWEVILNGDSPAPTRVVEGVLQPVAPTTVEQKLARKNELKARGTLLMALPDKHQLKFNSHKDVKTLMETIKNRFGGNTETKKVQKTLLKQQYENFTGSSTESLDQIHDRLQKLVSQHEIHAMSLTQEDVNLKFLRSLPSEWKTRTLIWRNKTDLEEQSLDDLFNSLKIYEAKVKHSSSAGTTTQNLAFVSSSNTDSTTESVSAAASVSAVCAKIPVSSLPNVDSLSNATGRNLGANRHTSLGFDMSKMKCYNCHRKGYFTRECRSPKDSKRNGTTKPQRRSVLVETSTSNALVSQCDGVGIYDWSFQAEEEPVNYALMAFSSSSSSFDNEVLSCSKACSKAYAQLHSQYDKLTADFRKSQFDVISYQTGLESVEARLLVYKQNESVFEEDIKLLNLKVQLKDNALVTLRQKLEKAEQERDDLKLKLQPSGGYHDVPPLYTGTFMPPKPDLVFNTAPTAVETDHSAFNVQLSPTKPEQDLSHINRPTAPIIKNWIFDFEDESATKAPQIVQSFVQSTKQVKSLRHSVQYVETSISAATPKPASLTPTSSGKRRNRKAYFVCKSLDHLIKDCDYREKQMAQPTTRNHAHRVLTQSKPVSITDVRPVSAVVPKLKVIKPRHAKPIVTKSNLPTRRHLTHSPSPTVSISPPRVTVVKAAVVNAAQGFQGNWEWRPKYPILDHVSRNTSASMILKRFDYNDALGRPKSVMAWVPKRI
uniref:CCHC-type domain-containing protein n=1 Tax=Tanacetum cinerariifolium TaxID=118510 RepID=A0A699ISR2_TANCI|nr:hypothetical protein [Tanacetum cinerariifolium]